MKQLRATVKKEFGKDMEKILGTPNITKKDRNTLIDNNYSIIVAIDETMRRLLENRHFKENIEINVQQRAELKALESNDLPNMGDN